MFYLLFGFVFFFKQKTAYEMRISDWSSDVCSSDLRITSAVGGGPWPLRRRARGLIAPRSILEAGRRQRLADPPRDHRRQRPRQQIEPGGEAAAIGGAPQRPERREASAEHTRP